jgi:hypothetical protein
VAGKEEVKEDREARDHTKGSIKEGKSLKRESKELSYLMIGMKKASKGGNLIRDKAVIVDTNMKVRKEGVVAKAEDVAKEKNTMMIKVAKEDKVVVTRRNTTTIEGMMVVSDNSNVIAPLKNLCRRVRISLS